MILPPYGFGFYDIPFTPQRKDMGRKAKRSFWLGKPFNVGQHKALNKKKKK